MVNEAKEYAIRETRRIIGSIKARRERMGLSTMDLSRESGISNCCIWNMEKGNTKHPSITVLLTLEKTLDILERGRR